MKTLIALLLALAVYQHWDRAQALLSPPSAEPSRPPSAVAAASSGSRRSRTRVRLRRSQVAWPSTRRIRD